MTSSPEMTANLPATARPAANPVLRKHKKDTYVRLSDRAGIFRVASFAGWGGPGYSIPTCYNLIGPAGRIVHAVTADLIRALEPDEIHQAEIGGELMCHVKSPDATPIPRMFNYCAAASRRAEAHREIFADPVKTVNLAKRLFPNKRPISTMIPMTISPSSKP